MCLLMSGVPSHESSFSLEATVICFALKTIDKNTAITGVSGARQAGRDGSLYVCFTGVDIPCVPPCADIIGTCLTTGVFFPREEREHCE